jgi:cell division protein ZapD
MPNCVFNSDYDPRVILYEYPFNERIRTYLRLEQLFLRLRVLVCRDDAIDHHFAVQTLFDILEVASRSDLKTEILKDLERQKQVFNGYKGNPAISESVLQAFLDRLDSNFTHLRDDSGKIGHALLNDDNLMAVRSRMSIPGGTCAFDLPAYHHWQQSPVAKRQSDLARWQESLSTLFEPVDLLLNVLRSNGLPRKVMTQGGLYQQNLPQNKTFQLLRLHIQPSWDLVPEISGNRLLYSIRLLERGDDGRLQMATEHNIELEVSLCA